MDVEDDLPEGDPPMSPFELYRLHCHLNAITRPSAVRRLWREHLRELKLAEERADWVGERPGPDGGP